MSTYSNLLLIFILVAAILLENDAHHCGCLRKKTKKKCEEKAITTTPTPTTTITNCDPHTCNSEGKPFCYCEFFDPNIKETNYPVPESGNCDDVTKNNYSSTTIPHYNYKCSKIRHVCSVMCICAEENVDQIPTPTPTPTTSQTQTQTPTPTPALCYTGTCNKETDFCSCDIDRERYPLPESGNCSDVVLRHLSTTPVYYYRFGFDCTKKRNICSIQCVCRDENVVDQTSTPMQKITTVATKRELIRRVNKFY